MGNPLVAAPKGPSATAGAGLLSDVAILAGDSSALDFTLDGVSTGLDAISMVMDPFGAIASAGVGWLLQHVDFLREPIDKLTGSASEIHAASQTWTNITKQLQQAAQQYQGDLAGVASWTGSAADDYRTAAGDYITMLEAVAGQCSTTAQGIEIAGVLVATERALIYDALSGFIGRCVVEAVAALASSWFTFGGSIAALIAAVDVDASIQAEKFAMDIGALMRKVGTVAQKLDGISSRAEQLGKAMFRAGGKVRQVAGRTKGLKTIATNRYLRKNPDGAVSTLKNFDRALSNSPLGTVHRVFDKKPVKPIWTGVKQGQNQTRSDRSGP